MFSFENLIGQLWRDFRKLLEKLLDRLALLEASSSADANKRRPTFSAITFQHAAQLPRPLSPLPGPSKSHVPDVIGTNRSECHRLPAPMPHTFPNPPDTRSTPSAGVCRFLPPGTDCIIIREPAGGGGAKGLSVTVGGAHPEQSWENSFSLCSHVVSVTTLHRRGRGHSATKVLVCKDGR